MKECFEFCINIAQVPLRIISLSKKMRDYCKKYLISNDSFTQVTIEITTQDIEKEAEYLKVLKAQNYKLNPLILEFDAILRKIADVMLDYDVLLFHASAISINSKAFLFAAPSGTGKSTHTKFWKELYGDQVDIINDDKPLIKCDRNGVRVFGSPWDGKERLSSLNSAELESICFLKRGTENIVFKTTQHEIISELCNQIFIPTDKTRRTKVFYLLDKILKAAKLYIVYCNNSIESAKVVSDTLLNHKN